MQVAVDTASLDTRKREFGAFEGIEDNYPKYVIRMDDFAGGNYEGIQTMNITDFLLRDC